jgi:hypothetical protein
MPRTPGAKSKSPREKRAEADRLSREADYQEKTGYKNKPGGGRPKKDEKRPDN